MHHFQRAVHEMNFKPLNSQTGMTDERAPHEGFGFGVLFDGDAGVLAVIREDTPAMRCGQLRNGDRVVAINGQRVRVASDLNTLMPADVTTVTLELVRGGVTSAPATSAAGDAKVKALSPGGGTNGGTPGDAKVKALGPVTRWVNSRRCKSLVHERDSFKAKSQADRPPPNSTRRKPRASRGSWMRSFRRKRSCSTRYSR